VNAFGLATIRGLAATSGPVLLNAFDTNGLLIDAVAFDTPFVDGVIMGADPFSSDDDFEYGFFGVYSPESTIGSILIHEDQASFDDLHFGVVPEPATWLGLALFAAYCARRRPV
jgi:hypothetical protein